MLCPAGIPPLLVAQLLVAQLLVAQLLVAQIQFTQDCARGTAHWWERCPPSRMLNVLAQ